MIWNPWHGCRRFSEGCQHCYMFYLDKERGRDGGEIFRVKGDFSLPTRKKRDGTFFVPSGTVVTTCFTSDFFLPEADAWREEAWEQVRARPDLLFFFLTKRIARVPQCLPPDWGEGYENVLFHVTAENQKRADERIPLLLSLPAKHRGIVVAPMLEAVDLEKYLSSGLIEEVSVGGENYEQARPCRFEWVESVAAQCRRQNVTFSFFETGENFWKDGRHYYVPKRKQKEQAKRAGLDFTGRTPSYSLHSPLPEQIGLFDETD